MAVGVATRDGVGVAVGSGPKQAAISNTVDEATMKGRPKDIRMRSL